MRELRFHEGIYDGKAVDAAVKVYDRFAGFELAREDAHFIVRITASSPARERQIAGELGNYALGLTIQGHGPA